MAVHRSVLRDLNGEARAEIRWSEGLLYKQNRSYDVEMPFDEFIASQVQTKKMACERGQTLDCTVVENDTKWEAV